MEQKIMKFGVIGPGGIAHTFAKAVALCDDVEIAAVASRSMERSKEFAAQYGVPTVYDNYTAIIEDPNIDGIYIGVPHMFHADIASECIKHKKAVLCEKPYGLTLKQAQDIAALAGQEQVLFMEAMWTRFLPCMAKAHEWIAAGKIGKVVLVDSDWGFAREPEPEHRLYKRELGGGAILDLGIYGILFSLDFAGGKVEKIAGVSTVGITDVDETATAQLKFDNGVISSFDCSFRTVTNRSGYIYGTEGCIELPRFMSAQEVKLYNNTKELVEHYEESFESGFYFEVEHFAELWRNGKIESPIMPWSATVAAAEVYDKLLEEWGLSFAELC